MYSMRLCLNSKQCRRFPVDLSHTDTNSVTHQVSILMPFRVAPVLEKESLRILLTLTIAKPSLSFGPRYQMIFRQIDLQVFSYRATDLRFWTPSATILLLSYPTNVQTLISPFLTNCYATVPYHTILRIRMYLYRFKSYFSTEYFLFYFI